MTLFILKMLKEKLPIARLRRISISLRQPLLSVAKRLGLKILTREDILGDSEKYHVLQFASEEYISATPPYNNLDEVPSVVKDKIGTWILKKPFVFEVPNAELIGSTAVGCDRNGKIILETVVPEHYDKLGIPTRTLILKNLPRIGVSQLDTVCSLVNRWSEKNYFHWIVEGLTRIEGLEYFQQQTGIKPILIIDANPPSWKIESLKLLGYGPENWIKLHKSRIKVKRLIVPSFRRDQYQISPAACRWLRQRMINNITELGSEKLSFSSKIYISRPKTAGRRVINEDNVLKALTPFGFVGYTLENMSFSDQVRLFSQAEVVVAPHGAGLTNIIFSSNLTVIEIFGSWVAPCYFSLAKALGFQYGCLRFTSPDISSGGTIRHGDIMVDVAKLQILVAKMQEIRLANRVE